ncbi:hypothetical protein [Sphaerisporangium rufum]|uniref:hypothetical protein n=1 Tax=Sphaerisporangium rufum TaxID=1381558 RepID=UPI00194E9E9F|nr:hypothetical protein [Sphaerisporangium rufum]
MAVIGAAATVVAAVIGVLGSGDGDHATAASPPPTTAFPATPPFRSGSSNSTPLTPATTDSAEIRFQGRVRLTSGGLDLDHIPPDSSFEELRYETQPGPGLRVDPALAAALWRTSGAPTRKACAHALDTSPLSPDHRFDDPAPGTTFCLRTNRDRVAFVQVLQAVDEGLALQVIVWDGGPG